MFRKIILIFLFFISIKVYAVAETAVFDRLIDQKHPKKVLQSNHPSLSTAKSVLDTNRYELIVLDSFSYENHQKDSVRQIPFFFFEQKVSSYKEWLKFFQVF